MKKFKISRSASKSNSLAPAPLPIFGSREPGNGTVRFRKSPPPHSLFETRENTAPELQKNQELECSRSFKTKELGARILGARSLPLVSFFFSSSFSSGSALESGSLAPAQLPMFWSREPGNCKERLRKSPVPHFCNKHTNRAIKRLFLQ